MVADAIHSLSDLATDVVTLAFVKLSSRAPDQHNPFGYYKYEALGASVVSLSLSAAGLSMAYYSALGTAKFNINSIICRRL